MTITVTTAPQSAPHRLRRNIAFTLAGVALFASTAVGFSRIADDDSPRTAPDPAPTALIGIEDVVRGSLPAPTALIGIEDVVRGSLPAPTALIGIGDVVRGSLPAPTGLVGVEDVVRGFLVERPN